MSSSSTQPSVSITLIGPGAIGSALAAGLIEAGHQPTIVARTPFQRLHVTWPDGETSAEVQCVSDVADVVVSDVVVVATKATHNAAIANHVRAATGPGSALVIAQNGVNHLERFDGLDPGVDVLPAIPMLPSEREAPGRAIVGKPSRLVVPAGPGAAALEELFAGSHITIDADEDWLTAAWFKLVLNASSGGIGVLARRGSDIYGDADVQQLALAVMEEVAAVGRAEGAALAPNLAEQMLAYQVANAGSHTTSIVVDRLAGVATEWRVRNEVVVRVAERHGIDVPLNRAIVTLMRLGEPS